MFAERLDFAMKVTQTSAAALGRASSLDASHVSRLRNGARDLPRDPAFLPAMAEYISRRVLSEYQREAMRKAVGVALWPDDASEAANLVRSWLSGSASAESGVAAVIKSVAATTLQDNGSGAYANANRLALPEAKSYYYGDDGRREAVLQFFYHVLASDKPQTLLLVSEENMGWLYESPSFAAKWAAMFKDVIAAGNRVKIIHTLNRDVTEFFEAIAKWIPIYMTGAIEPYYCPKIRDGIYKRTLFVAPECCAVASSSIGYSSEGMLNEFVTDLKAVNALSMEFNSYVELCRPLMKIERGEDVDLTLDNVRRLLGDGSASSLVAFSPTMLDRVGSTALGFEIKAIAAQDSAIDVVQSREMPDNLLIVVREFEGVTVVKMDDPLFSFSLTEPRFTSAFWDYLVSL